MRRLAVLAAVAVPAVLLVFLGREAGSSGDWSMVRRDDLVVGVEVSGTLEAVESARLGPPQVASLWDYKISFLAPEGAFVRKGQPVLGFDSSQLETTLQEAAAARDSAEKELEKTRTDLEMRRREEELHLAEAEAGRRRSALKAGVPAEVIAANELRQTRSELNLAVREIAFRKDRLRLLDEQERAEMETLRSKRDRSALRLREAEAAIAAMTVAAPRDGTVVYESGRGGEKKKVGDSCWRGESVLEIPDLRRMRAVGQIDEADAGRVSAGQKVRLRLDAHPDVAFTGVVSATRGSVQARSRGNPSKVVEVGIDLDRTDSQRMSPGMRFVGTVEVERAPHVLTVPAEAVFNRPDGPVVVRRRPGMAIGERIEEVRPRLGRRNGRLVEVLSGLAEGDRVALRDPDAGRGEEP